MITNENNNKISLNTKVYFRFLELVDAIKELPEGEGFGINEKAMLDKVLFEWFKKTPLTVSQLLKVNQLGSPATLHKRLTRLRKLGFIATMPVNEDKRTKILIPTDKGLHYAQQLGEACLATVNLYQQE